MKTNSWGSAKYIIKNYLGDSDVRKKLGENAKSVGLLYLVQFDWTLAVAI